LKTRIENNANTGFTYVRPLNMMFAIGAPVCARIDNPSELLPA